MMWKLAWRNIYGAGLRSIINIFILAFVIIGIIWMEGMYEGWMRIAERQSKEWECAGGRYEMAAYDRFDPFSWDKSHAVIPLSLQPLVQKGDAVPILISTGSIFPQGRMKAVVIKGIPAGQTALKLPTKALADSGEYIPALIGTNMAKSSALNKGDIVTLRWKDVHGAFNAADIVIAEVMQTPVMSVDNDQLWLDLNRLQQMKDLPQQTTFIVLKSGVQAPPNVPGWRFLTVDDMLADLHEIMQTETKQAYITYAILLFLAMIAIFDTQVLAVFRRRKEIGTLTALGMTAQRIILLFTVEGMLYAVLASGAAAILGMPLFIYFGTRGWLLPESFQDFGIAGFKDPVVFEYTLGMVISTLVLVISLTAFVSWIPALRIARLKPTDALRGKLR